VLKQPINNSGVSLLVSLSLMLLTLLLVACGESAATPELELAATPGPAFSPNPTFTTLPLSLVLTGSGQTTIPASIVATPATSVPAIASATLIPVPATSVPATNQILPFLPTVTSTPVAATPAARSTSVGLAATPVSTATLPKFSNLREIKLDPTLVFEFSRQVQPLGLANPVLKLYVSDDEVTSLTERTAAFYTETGYTFGIPGISNGKPVKMGDTNLGLYLKSGVPDVLLAVRGTNDAQELMNSVIIPGLNVMLTRQIVDQVKGSKSVMFILVAPNLFQIFLSSFGLPVLTNNSTPTRAVNSGPQAGENDLPVYPAAKKLNQVSNGGATSVYYVSSANYKDIISWARASQLRKTNAVLNGLNRAH